jgi:hypothetical protein
MAAGHGEMSLAAGSAVPAANMEKMQILSAPSLPGPASLQGPCDRTDRMIPATPGTSSHGNSRIRETSKRAIIQVEKMLEDQEMAHRLCLLTSFLPAHIGYGQSFCLCTIVRSVQMKPFLLYQTRADELK